MLRVVAAASLVPLLMPILPAFAQRVLTPEQFGAKGDGKTNDTCAFQAVAAAVNAQGCGTVVLRAGATYIVGGQYLNPNVAVDHYIFHPVNILSFRGCAGAIEVVGNGATLRAYSGYRYGTFDASGRKTVNAQPFYGLGAAAAYFAMIAVENCSGPVTIGDVILDGNAGNAIIGGKWGDTGWQLPGSGLIFRNNRGKWRVSNVRSFHHPLDGIMVDDPGNALTPLSRSGTSDCQFYENGRQGMSFVGGVGHVFTRTSFNRTRRNVPVQSAPGAGVDLEAEGGKVIRNLTFDDCDMVDNYGAALLQLGPVSEVTVRASRLTGTGLWAFYPSGGRNFRFERTQIVGAITNLMGGVQGERFEQCLLTNDPALGAGGRAPYSPAGFLIPDAVRGVHFAGGEIRHAVPQVTFNGNFDQMILDGITVRATRGAVAVYGRYRGKSRFIEAGGAILATPGGLATSRSSGGADAPWSLTRAGKLQSYPATPPRK